ncbi:hypothetical protein CSIV_04290 [Microbacterium sp. CSI-V]|uniref:hypothetical protein n=1 Tax=unclassified Microbacterium TaxID=2609290 RepID=UPI00097BB30E|nr:MULTISPECIES: hypothetical protein [unclassified Microbacterium]MXS74722.1 hypothetical protein [Microbacterium sp. TL13]ONI65512.1 hypothetical protein CSIV_04290 [Microbacterium sp. CSI-V]
MSANREHEVKPGDVVLVQFTGAERHPEGTITSWDEVGVNVVHDSEAGYFAAFYPWPSIQRLYKKIEPEVWPAT